MDPVDGTFTNDTGDYSPAALVFLDFTWRLAGVRQLGNTLEWNVRPPENKVGSTYRLQVAPTKTAEIRYASGRGELLLNGKVLYRTNNVVRLITDFDGKIQSVVGIASEATTVNLRHASGHEQKFSIAPNANMTLQSHP
jgi:hypothetical protein